MTKKIVIFFDERLNTDFRIVRFGKFIPISQELDNIYMFINDRNLWNRCKKKMRENQSHIKIKNQSNYNMKKEKNAMFVTKEDLKKLGFGNYQAYSLIKQAKALMVQKGFAYYNSKGLGQVPVEAVEEILGTKLNFEEVEEYA